MQIRLIRKMVDSNFRLLSQGMQNLVIYADNAKKGNTQKISFIVKSLRNKDTKLAMMAWNGLKESWIIRKQPKKDIAKLKSRAM